MIRRQKVKCIRWLFLWLSPVLECLTKQKHVRVPLYVLFTLSSFCLCPGVVVMGHSIIHEWMVDGQKKLQYNLRVWNQIHISFNQNLTKGPDRSTFMSNESLAEEHSVAKMSESELILKYATLAIWLWVGYLTNFKIYLYSNETNDAKLI